MAFCAMHGVTQRRRELAAVGEFDYVPCPAAKPAEDDAVGRALGAA